MQFGKVIGMVWATVKDPNVQGRKLMFVEPMNFDGDNKKTPLVAVDTVGAGVGEYVIFVTSTEAIIPLKSETTPMAAVDATIVGIVDSVEIDRQFRRKIKLTS
jgi:ethanolamine utilization protein EutN